LFITLSNLGDIILTTPVLGRLHKEFPGAYIDVITGAPGKEIFMPHPAVRKVTVHVKRRSIGGRLREVMAIRGEKYDMVVDLKNTLIPYLAGAKYHTRVFIPVWPGMRSARNNGIHKRDEHLAKLSHMGMDISAPADFFMPSGDTEKKFIDGILAAAGGEKTVVIAPGAKSHLKRWPARKYAMLANRLVAEFGCRVYLTGDAADKKVIEEVAGHTAAGTVSDICCKTSVSALGELMRRSDLVITNDSAPLHVASAVNTPTVAVFGPSDEKKYGPLAGRSRVIKPRVPCRPCGKALCSPGPDEGCITLIGVDEVFEAAREILGG
ncbi:MAG: glycosyltransferase family 9 protein, partial [Candidatus Omnitrophota bacterium]